MKVYSSIKPLVNRVDEIKRSRRSIGLVPTMGFLHEGHLSLIREARRDTDLVVVSIFVNPIQFGPKEDFKKYPRDLKHDLGLCRKAGVDIVFSTNKGSMYPRGFSTYVNVEGLTNVLCGAKRPGHFRGVTTVVTKLFNIVKPDIAYFGQKDAQQTVIIKKMVDDLNVPVKIKEMPVARERDGLAMSSRNTYLS
ncbi:MAG: pantoate--beta-alanine ligase, partial [Candidatus Omnitrophota bacterium]